MFVIKHSGYRCLYSYINVYLLESAHIAMTCVTEQSVPQVAWSYISLLRTGERPYGYDMSNKAFVDTGNLKVRSLLHTGDNPCLCNICNKTVSQKCVPMRLPVSYFLPGSKILWYVRVNHYCALCLESSPFTNMVSLSLVNLTNFFHSALM